MRAVSAPVLFWEAWPSDELSYQLSDLLRPDAPLGRLLFGLRITSCGSLGQTRWASTRAW
jgi:hypothetical protein